MWHFKSSKQHNNYEILKQNRDWIDFGLLELVIQFGIPDSDQPVFNFSSEYFPKTFSSSEIHVEALISDLQFHFELEKVEINYTYYTDIGSVDHIPFEQEGFQKSSYTTALNGIHTIHLAESLKSKPSQLVHRLIYELVLIYLVEINFPFADTPNPETFVYLAGIYLGFGTTLLPGLSETGYSNDGFWEKNWTIVSEFPDHEMLFAMVTRIKVIMKGNLDWIHHLSKADQKIALEINDFLDSNPSIILTPEKIEACSEYSNAKFSIDQGKAEKGIELLRSAIKKTSDLRDHFFFLHNIGYQLLVAGELNQALVLIEESLEIDPLYSYALDNKGYCLIQLGKLEEGLSFVEKSMAIGDNQDGYSYRNLALYYQAKGNPTKSEECFKKALEYDEYHVDLLHYHYALFLESKGDLTGAIEHLEKSASFKEEQGIEKLKYLRESE